MKSALITGITGQDGSYLADLLLSKGYEVHGLVRRTSSLERSRLKHLYLDNKIYNKSLFLHYVELDDAIALQKIILKFSVAEIYHLAGQSHVGLSFELPELTLRDNMFPTLCLLEVVRHLGRGIKFLHASSSEIFGNPDRFPQNELTSHAPITPYGCSKSCATFTVSLYRQVYDLFAVNCIMFNHESPRRSENFISRKICKAAVQISRGTLDRLELGNIDINRDWGHAIDYVRAMWLAMQDNAPRDYVIASGVTRSVKNILDVAFCRVGLDWRDWVVLNPRMIRSVDPSNLVGDSSLAKSILGWEPTYSFEDMIAELVDSEMSVD